jgi:hypothetical protein
MSRTRTMRARGALSMPLLAAGAAALSGCSGATSTTSSATAATASATGYVLSAPSSIDGWKLTTPTSSTQQQMQQGLNQAEQAVGGVSGTPVTGLYDDTADQMWVVFVGLNGSGFEPSRLATAAEAVPVSTVDGIGDRTTTSWVTRVSGGPHGGQTDCQQTLEVQVGLSTYSASGLATTGSVCYWMTATTFGVVTLYPQANRNDWDFGYTGQQMDGFMLKVRAAVEQRR